MAGPELHCETVGDGDRTLLVLPGWRLDSVTELADWRPILEQHPDWRGVFADLPGTGRSRAATAGIESQADVLTRVVELADSLHTAQAPRTLAVAGTSNGAALALGLARRRPQLIDGLALRVPMLQPDDDLRGGPDPDSEVLDTASPAYRQLHGTKVAQLWQPARARTDAAFLEQIRRDPSRYGLPEATDPEVSFAKPALVVLGRQDGRVGWEHAWRLLAPLPHATVALLDQAGHALPVGEAQQRLWQVLVDDWMSRME